MQKKICTFTSKLCNDVILKACFKTNAKDVYSRYMVYVAKKSHINSEYLNVTNEVKSEIAL